MTKNEILEKILPVKQEGQWHVMSGEISGKTIQEAIETYGMVEVPLSDPIVLSDPLVLSSDNHIKFDKNQKILQAEEVNTCLLRNKNIQDGAFRMPDGKRDKNISIEGGIWKIKSNGRGRVDHEHSMRGCLALIVLCCVEQVWVHDLTITDSGSYGVQICDCKDFTIENIHFDHHHKDGIHVNGPASYGVIRQLDGNAMDDDMVAMNAWDWCTSAITFGTIDHVVVEDIKSTENEIRLLPGQKVFDDGTRVDCDIRDCFLENISGIYTFKMYAQPNIANAIHGTNDVSGTVGTIRNVHIKNISFLKVQPAGFNNLPVKSLFEICADCDNITIENINVDNTIVEADELDVRLVNAGPLSAVWTNGSDDPAKWGEVFDPDAICFVDNLTISGVKFAGEEITDKERLIREVNMTVNPDYPNTTPRGGTGYGRFGRVAVK